MPDIIDPFHKSIYEVVANEINKRLYVLGSGSALSYEDYKQQVGYIHALNDMIEWCQKIEIDKYGERKRGDEE